MKRIMQVMVISFFTAFSSLSLTACVLSKSEPLTQKLFNPEDARVINGEKVYMAYCQKCHPAGESGLAPAINSNPAPQLIKRFQVRHGLGVIPPFSKNEISKNDLHDISKYLKAWKRY